MMKTIACLLLTLVPAVLSLDCNGPAEIVIAVPGSEAVPDEEFKHLENFLIGLVSYYTISESNTRVGLVLYGRQPVVVSNLGDAPSTQSINTRITLLTQRASLASQISGGQNVPKAISKVHAMLSAGRSGVPKIGIIMTYGNADLSSSDPQTVRTNVAAAAGSALDRGIHLFATSTGGTVPGFPDITGDNCRLFSLGKYTGLGSLLPYLGSTTCYVLDPHVNPTPEKCFPDLLGPPKTTPFRCGSGYEDSFVADPTNCAYYYRCPKGIRQSCGLGQLFDPNIMQCNHKAFVSCYSRIFCPRPNGIFPHPRDSSKFLLCNVYIPYVFDCPDDLVYDASKKRCEHPPTDN